ncbi:MAG TPA: hypothetical protein VE868_06650 [Balneolaceae bacterium]|nr:hypothetical protein [Balneolaceae bacterium]
MSNFLQLTEFFQRTPIFLGIFDFIGISNNTAGSAVLSKSSLPGHPFGE